MDSIKDAFDQEYRDFLARHAQLPENFHNDYEVVSCLWESSEKETYLIRAKADKREFILKIASLRCREDLSAEYALLKSLSHESLPQPVSYFEQNGRGYLIREYVRGKSLAQYVDEKGVLDAVQTVRIALRLCDAVAYLHALEPPVIHRDIKPQNVVITPEGEIRLIDLGIARRYHEDAARDTVFMGTEATAAPEQFGYMQTDERTDIYSLGALLLFLLSESFDVQNIARLVTDRQLAKVIGKCTNFSPDGRYPSIAHLRTALRRIRPAAKKRPYATIAASIAVGLVLGLAGGIALRSAPLGVWDRLYPQPEAAVLATIAPTAPLSTPAVAQQTPAPTAQDPDAVTFVSPLIDKAVRAQLGKAQGEPIRKADLAHVTKLLICGDQSYNDWYEHFANGADQYLYNEKLDTVGTISDLSDVAKLYNLSELALYNQNVSDLGPLRGLHLTKLGLGSNAVSDFSALSHMDTLRTLDLSNTPVSDLSPLRDIARLKELDLSRTAVTDFSQLRVLSLERLSLMGSDVADYSFLSDLPSLTSLRTQHLSASDVSLVATLHNLTEWTAYSSDVSDLRFLKSLPNLTLLDLTGCKVTSLEGVQSCPNLVALCMGNNPYSSLEPLRGLKKLRYLDIFTSGVTDFSPIASLPAIEQIGCNSNQKESLQPIADKKGVKLLLRG